MTSTTFSLVPSRHAGARVTTRAMGSNGREKRKTVRVDTGSVLRIVDGRGLRLTATSGVLWLTEEGNPDDVVLLAGDSHRIANGGLTLVLAHRASRVLLTLPSGAFLPRRVDVVPADGGRWRRVAFSARYAIRLRRMGAAVLAIVRKAIVAFAALASSPRRPARSSDRDALSRDVPFPYH